MNASPSAIERPCWAGWVKAQSRARRGGAQRHLDADRAAGCPLDTVARLGPLPASGARVKRGGLFQLVGDLVEAGLGARLVLLAAGRAGHADCPDDLVADLDRQCPLRRDDAAEVDCAGGRIVLDAL